MKKAISALVSGLLLSGIVAALYEAFGNGQKQERFAQPQETDRQKAARQKADRRQAKRKGHRESRSRRSSGLLDLNSCSHEDLASLAGLDDDSVGRIIENRPYRNKLDLLSRMVIPEATYVVISQFVTASEPGESVKVAS